LLISEYFERINCFYRTHKPESKSQVKKGTRLQPLDRYLLQIEKLISHLPISVKTEVLTNIKKRIDGEKETFPDRGLPTIFKELGTKANLINEYLLNMGLPPIKKKLSLGAWIFMTFIGCSLLMIIAGAVFISKITPLFEINEKTGRIILLGGMVDIDPSIGSVKIDSHYNIDLGDQHSFKASIDKVTNIKEIDFNFKAGKIEVVGAKDGKVSWDCKLSKEMISGFTQSDSKINFDFTDFRGVQCLITIPENIKLNIEGEDGYLIFSKIKNKVEAELTNGRLVFHTINTERYNINANVSNGKVRNHRSNDDGGYAIKLNVDSGEIIVK
jgi:hypothetical protein